MDANGLEVLDVENLRRHYALTLDAWAERFDANWDAIQALDPVRFNERHRRIWRTYLWSCAEMFRSRTSPTHLFQVTVSKGNVDELPDEPRRSCISQIRDDVRREDGAAAGRPRIDAVSPDRPRSDSRRRHPTCFASAPRDVRRASISATSTGCSASTRRPNVVEAEGMTTFADLADATLPLGAMPAVIPQLKSITLGGAVAGIGIEATSFRHGLVHDTIVAMEVLTGDGRIVACTADNEHRDLFHGFPNSYGTLGYALKLTARTIPVGRYVRVDHARHTDAASFFAALAERCADASADFVDGVVFDRNDLVLSCGRFVDEAPHVSDYTYDRIYYRSLREKAVDYLATRDYLWRWDTDWFWCSKNVGAQHPLVRRLLGRARLNSITYQQIMRWNARWHVTATLDRLRGVHSESVIQDVDIPLARAAGIPRVPARASGHPAHLDLPHPGARRSVGGDALSAAARNAVDQLRLLGYDRFARAASARLRQPQDRAQGDRPRRHQVALLRLVLQRRRVLVDLQPSGVQRAQGAIRSRKERSATCMPSACCDTDRVINRHSPAPHGR